MGHFFKLSMQTLTSVRIIEPAVIYVKISTALIYAHVSLDTPCHVITEHVKVIILVATY